MKKIFILLIIVILCTGCVRIDSTENIDIIVDEIINNKTNPNTMARGYKYFLPLGVSKTYDKDYNEKFKYESAFIYLYVDAVSYYYKNSLNFDEENNINNYYYRKITNGNKIGYIVIKKVDEKKYFLKIVYNYAKIEAYADKDNIEKVMTNSMIILDSIDYNDKLIEKILKDDYSIGVEKEYRIDKPKDARSKFSEYLSEDVQEEDAGVSDLPDY